MKAPDNFPGFADLAGRGFSCPSPESTRELAARLATLLGVNSVIALEGPLGAGKTEFVKGLAHALGCHDPVTSPTFAVAHEYPDGRLPIFHFDFYRLDSADEVLTSGFEDCLGNGVVVVEWASRFPGHLPANTLWVTIKIDSADARTVTFSANPCL
ncbi:MAG: tRNA (adenosine(37)-N6)-threonylcarbamoyltransferase complex ATPase subunit type 1 TsaE [Terrimicrobiaceae bacterium]